MAADLKYSSEQSESARRYVAPGSWLTHVNVREFIQRNYTPHEGDGAFLAGPTARTKEVWEKLQPLVAEEREKGNLDVSEEPSGILQHAPGYIDKEREIAYSNKLAPTERPDMGYAMIFPGMTVVKILFVDVIPALL